MNLTLSPPIKILALVGLVAAVGFAASMMLLGRPSETTSASQTPVGRTQRPATAPAAMHAKATAAPHVAKPVAAKTRARAAAKPKARPVPRGNLVYANLPKPLAWQLSRHKVVVVSLYNPKSDVDAISVAEAHAGAIDAGAGFLLVNVLDNTIAGLLTGLLPGGGLLPDPGVLVYRAPGDLALRIDGFADRAAVAQAAVNALTPGAGPTATTAAATAAAPAAAPSTTGP